MCKLLNPMALVDPSHLVERALQEYAQAQVSVLDLDDRIASIDARLTSTTSHMSLAPAHGGSASEHRMEDSVALKAQLEQERDDKIELIKTVDAALATLSDDERSVLSIAYIRRSKGTGDWAKVACDELHMARPTLFRTRKRAIQRLVTQLFPDFEVFAAS